MWSGATRLSVLDVFPKQICVAVCAVCDLESLSQCNCSAGFFSLWLPIQFVYQFVQFDLNPLYWAFCVFSEANFCSSFFSMLFWTLLFWPFFVHFLECISCDDLLGGRVVASRDILEQCFFPCCREKPQMHTGNSDIICRNVRGAEWCNLGALGMQLGCKLCHSFCWLGWEFFCQLPCDFRRWEFVFSM